ncbi:hypothetical protein GGR57DRAFT_280567 [Xylariaceae sp. FL1272]|nr:hypothetical protein GGR57DRAFT_280567 [Xylariaceae sp. FL1272]
MAEIAGLVFGAFTIALEALDRYRDVAKVVEEFWCIRSVYRISHQRLSMQRLYLSQNLRLLLLPLFGDDATVKRLISNPTGEDWKDPFIEEVLQKRLQDSFSAYIHVLHQMSDTMQRLNKVLVLDEIDLQAKLHDKESEESKRFGKAYWEFQAYRLKYSTSRSIRSELFDELESQNDDLEKLATRSGAIQILEKNRWIGFTAAEITACCNFWQHAEHLYRALLHTFSCPCQELHCAQLGLQYQLASNQKFSLILSQTDNEAEFKSATTWTTCSLHLQVVGKNQETPSPPAQTNRTSKPPVPKKRVALKSQVASLVKFQSHSRKPESSFAANEIHNIQLNPIPKGVRFQDQSGGPNTNSSTPKSDLLINDLCKSLSLVRTGSGLIGQDDRKYKMKFAHISPSKRMSLSQIILMGEEETGFARQQRLSVAVTLASSFVQLKDSPWLLETWSKGNIIFSVVDACIDFGPLIRRQFRPPHAAQTKTKYDLVNNIASLGIVLLELCFGQVIEQQSARRMLPPGDGMEKAAFDRMAASEWIKRVRGEAGSNYHRAVEWCLSKCSSSPLSQTTWRQEMLREVVAPLHRCVKAFEE